MVEAFFPASMFEVGGLGKLGGFFVEELDILSWYSSLDTKLAISGVMELVEEMDTDANREIITMGLSVTYLFLSLS